MFFTNLFLFLFVNRNWFGLMKFCEEVNLQVVPSIDIANDVAEIDDVLHQIKEYLDLFQGYKYITLTFYPYIDHLKIIKPFIELIVIRIFT